MHHNTLEEWKMRPVILLGIVGMFTGSTVLAAQGEQRTRHRALRKAGDLVERLAARLPGKMKFTLPLHLTAKRNSQLTQEPFHIPGGIPHSYESATKRVVFYKAAKWLLGLLIAGVGVHHGVTELGIPLTDVATLAKTAVKEAHPGWIAYAIPVVPAAILEWQHKRPVQLELLKRALDSGVKLHKGKTMTFGSPPARDDTKVVHLPGNTHGVRIQRVGAR